MRLPDEVQKSVVFLGQQEMDMQTNLIRDELRGTAFFVALRISSGAHLICLVTAAHVAKQLQHGMFFIRANTRQGEAKQYWLDGGVEAHWIFHPEDDSVDAAVLLWMPPDEVDYLCVHEDLFLSQEKIQKKKIGVGDEVYVTGLFRFLTGKNRNEPIIRAGNIAMIPKERIPVLNWHEDGMEGYLIEGRSIGGFSGSPVFVQRSIEVSPIEPTGRNPLAAGAIFWLGLMHGHWEVSENKIDGVRSKIDPEQAINAGISIVVPCHKIIEVLNHDLIRQAAVVAADEIIERHEALLDGGSPTQIKEGAEHEASRYATDSASLAIRRHKNR